jgi:hypothetical protein
MLNVMIETATKGETKMATTIKNTRLTTFCDGCNKTLKVKGEDCCRADFDEFSHRDGISLEGTPYAVPAAGDSVDLCFDCSPIDHEEQGR